MQQRALKRLPAIRTLRGPSLFASGPAVVAGFTTDSDPGPLASDRLEAALGRLRIPIGIPPGRVDVPFPSLVLAIARWLERGSGVGAAWRVDFSKARVLERPVVLAASTDEGRALRLMSAALMLTAVLDQQARDASDDTTVLASRSEAVRRARAIASAKPGLSEQDTVFVALTRERGIPSILLTGLSRMMLLGQGRHGRLVDSVANDRDSSIGTSIAVNKAMSNRMIAYLGFPSVRHRLVHDEASALEAARQIGFPLVVKPVASGMGKGVFAGITSLDECREAFRVASKYAVRGVLVEGYVQGDDHRLAVMAGRLAWAVVRRPAAVTGDGRSTIEALIAAENARRMALPVEQRQQVSPIEVDAELSNHLSKSGLDLTSVPASGRRVTLRSIANVSKGGTYEDLTGSVHPDNRAMAEAVAAGLRMDALGIDFITTDITRSWRETGGAIIEVNETPGAGTSHYVGIILDRMFPPGVRSRVDYVLLANVRSPRTIERTVSDARRLGHTVGFLSADETSVDGFAKGHAGQSLNQRMLSLLLDSRVSFVVASLRTEDLVEEGLLSDRIDRAVLGPGLPAEVENLVRSHSVVIESEDAAR